MYLYSVYTNFQLCTFNVHNMSNNVHNSMYSLYKIFQQMHVILCEQCTQIFNYVH